MMVDENLAGSLVRLLIAIGLGVISYLLRQPTRTVGLPRL
jgi:hypothetical protein